MLPHTSRAVLLGTPASHKHKGQIGVEFVQGSMVLLFTGSNGASMESAITVKGQATIPKAIREHLGLNPGDRVKFFVHPDGSVALLRKLPAVALRGMLKSRRRRPVTIEQMSRAAVEGAVSGNRRRRPR